MKCPKCYTERPGNAPRCVCGYDYPLDSTSDAPGENRAALPALLILVGFFLPWAQLLGQGISGYELGKVGSYGNWAWVAPLTAGYVLIRWFTGASVAGGQLAAGLAPFIGLLYGLANVGTGLFHVLSIGAYLTLIGAGVLLAQYFTSSSSASAETIAADTTEPTTCLECSKPIPAGAERCPACGWSYKSQ